MLLGTLGASLLQNLSKSKDIIREVDGTNAVGQGF